MDTNDMPTEDAERADEALSALGDVSLVVFADGQKRTIHVAARGVDESPVLRCLYLAIQAEMKVIEDIALAAMAAEPDIKEPAMAAAIVRAEFLAEQLKGRDNGAQEPGTTEAAQEEPS